MANVNTTRTLLKTRYWHSDEYVGTAEQLCACGLVQPGQFPGQPGLGKTRATYFLADREPVPHCGSKYELTYTVQRVGSTRFSVLVSVSAEEAGRRKTLRNDKGKPPLDLPQTTHFPATPTAPTWTPTGFAFRCRREHESDYVFEASVECLRASGIMGVHALPELDDKRCKTIRFESHRFGWVIVAQRTARTFFVILRTPREIGNADYESTDYGHTVYHNGTKQQLQARGLGVSLGFPGEPGCNKRKVSTVIPETGSEMCIELMVPRNWCGDVPRFEVMVRRSEAEQEAQKKFKQAARAKKARLEILKAMPATPDKFRDGVAETFWNFVNVTKAQMQPRDGYSFTSEMVEEFIETALEAYWTIKKGETAGSSPRKKLEQVMCESAKADETLQRFLAGLDSATAD